MVLGVVSARRPLSPQSFPLSQVTLLLAESMKSHRIVIGCLCLVVLICAGCDQPKGGSRRPSTANSSAELTGRGDLIIASQALQQNNLAAAEAAIRSQLLKDPSDPRALELSGDIASRRGDNERAIAMYRATVNHSGSPAEPLMDKLAQQLMVAGRAFDAVTVLQQRVERYPNSRPARYDLVGLATVLGQPDIAVPSLRWLSQRGFGYSETLQVLADPQRVEPDEKLCRTLLERYPKDSRPEFGLARLNAQKMEWQKVTERLRPVLAQHKDFLPAYTLYGLALTELDDFESVAEWQRRVPGDAESSPEYWLVAGLWAEHQGNHQQAARAFWEAVRLDETGYPRAIEIVAQFKTDWARA